MIGLFLEYYDPFPLGAKYNGKLFNFNSYSHQIDAIGGFISSNIDLGVIEPIAEDWLEHGLGRIIQIKDNYLNKVFRGTVDSIVLTIGGDSETRGPLFDVGNRSMAIYTPRTFPPNGPPVDGTTTTTILTDDTDSQALFGIIEKDVSAGSCPDDVAEKVRDTFLFENSYPKTTGNLSLDQSIGYNLTLNIVGNYKWFSTYVYNNLTEALITMYQKLVAIMAADPNGVISTNLMKMEDNVYAVEQLEIDNRFAWDILGDMLALGNDVDDRKRSFGMYDDDIVIYRVQPNIAKYIYKLGDQRQCIKDTSGVVVLPWMVRPGDWINVPDWLLGRKIYSPTSLNQDPRNKYIETVNYSAPYSVSLSGTPFDNLSRMLAKITYTGGIY